MPALGNAGTSLRGVVSRRFHILFTYPGRQQATVRRADDSRTNIAHLPSLDASPEPPSRVHWTYAESPRMRCPCATTKTNGDKQVPYRTGHPGVCAYARMCKG